MVVHTGKEGGYRYIHRATLGAVLTVCTRDKGLRSYDLNDLFYSGMFLFVKLLEILHIRNVVDHHVHIAHTGKHHFDALKACGKSYSIACLRAASKSVEDGAGLLGKGNETSSLYRLHYNDGL